MHPASIGIIGNGAFGAFTAALIRKLAPGIEVRIHSSRQAPAGSVFFSFEDACAADVLVLAVPIRAFEATLLRALPHLDPATILVDVASVKMHTAKMLKLHASGRPYIATHPMFGPESYAKRGDSVAGFRIVVAEHTLPEGDYQRLESFLAGCGFDVIRMPPDRHDKHLAETLFLTHFVSQTVARAGFTRTEIDTVSFGFLMDAVESVRNDTSLFADVFRFNPYCKETLDRFEQAEEETRTLLEETQTAREPIRI